MLSADKTTLCAQRGAVTLFWQEVYPITQGTKTIMQPNVARERRACGASAKRENHAETKKIKRVRRLGGAGGAAESAGKRTILRGRSAVENQLR
jgi:hypothetical protein